MEPGRFAPVGSPPAYFQALNKEGRPEGQAGPCAAPLRLAWQANNCTNLTRGRTSPSKHRRGGSKTKLAGAYCALLFTLPQPALTTRRNNEVCLPRQKLRQQT